MNASFGRNAIAGEADAAANGAAEVADDAAALADQARNKATTVFDHVRGKWKRRPNCRRNVAYSCSTRI